ncbi:ankyrin repeat and MYND domain-containing protein 1 isoform X2 [Lissotriton helveticus]
MELFTGSAVYSDSRLPSVGRMSSSLKEQRNMEQVDADVWCPEKKVTQLPQMRSFQQWADGSSYKGHFEVDVKLGHGEFIWANGERYMGEFYKDHPHGKGIYTWPDISTFTGSFYLGRKEGYGTMEFLDNHKFQGLYKADERFGPGVETYLDDRQDVGLWHNDHLIRLPTKVPESFSLSQYPDYLQNDGDTPQKTLDEKQSSVWTFNLEEEDPYFIHYKLLALEDSYTLPETIHTYSNDTDHLPITSSFRQKLDSKFFQDNEPLADAEDVPPPIRNLTPLMVRMQKQIYKHRHNIPQYSWDVDSVVNGVRENFGPKGPKELNSERLIIKSGEGEYEIVYEILRDNLAHVDVADDTGHTALQAAAIIRHDDIINLLLDSGADVNKVNDEGLSPLSVCLLAYYPASSFKPNIAERNLPKVKIEEFEDPPPKAAKVSSKGKKERSKEKEKEHQLPRSSSCFDIEPEEEPICVTPGSPATPVTKILPSTPKSKKKGISKKKLKLINRDAVKASDVDPTFVNEESADSLGTPLFESNCSIFDFDIEISEDILQWSADILSHNVPLEDRTLNEGSMEEGTVRKMAQSKSEYRQKWATIELLLRRGADPNVSSTPMHALFYAVKSADVYAVQVLLEKGARTDIRLPTKSFGLTPLHIAVALPVKEGVDITELLLNAAADSNARAEDQDDIYGPDRCDNANAVAGFPLKVNNSPEVFCNYYMKPNIAAEEGGRTPLHVVSEREDCPKRARDIVHLLLKHAANTNTLWSGHSPLSLAIASGNDPAVKELLANGVDTNLPLGRYVGSALCAALNPAYEKKRTLQARIALVDRLVNAGANVLMPITIGEAPKTVLGTATDYGYYKFFQAKVESKDKNTECEIESTVETDTTAETDKSPTESKKDKKLAHTPYHALSHGERNTINARKQLLEHMGDLVREAATRKEKEWVNQGLHRDINGLYTSGAEESEELVSSDPSLPCRKIAFKYCYQCGRSVGVRLFPCPRCHAVYFCSKTCQKKSWEERHKNECIRFQAGKSKKDQQSKSMKSQVKEDKKSAKKTARIGREVPPGYRYSSKDRSETSPSTRLFSELCHSQGNICPRTRIQGGNCQIDKHITCTGIQGKYMSPHNLKHHSTKEDTDKEFVENYSFN